MKRILILSLLLFPLLASAQFRIVGTGLFTTLNDSTYRARIDFRPDLTGNSYNPTQLDTSMLVLSQAGQLYRLDSFFSNTFSSAWIVLVEKNGNWGSPRGQIMVFQTPGRLAAPQAVYAANGATAAMQAGVDTWNAKLFGQIVDSTFLWTESYDNMVDSIRFESDPSSTLYLFQRDGDTLSAPLFPVVEASFDTSTILPSRRHLRWSNDDATLALGVGFDGLVHRIGQELFYPNVINKTASTIKHGIAVMVDPVQLTTGDHIRVVPANGSGAYPSKLVMGIMSQDLPFDSLGFVTWFGYVRNVKESDIVQTGITLAQGDILYLSATQPGKLTNIEPSPPAIKVPLAVVVRRPNANNLTLLVRPWLNEDLTELNDVKVDSVVQNQILRYDTTGGYWAASTSAGIVAGDTAAMLAPYIRYVDTVSTIATKANLALKLDTSTLSSIVKYVDTVFFIATKEDLTFKLNAVDTASLSNRIDEKLNALDTASLSDRINLKFDSSLIVGYIPWGDTIIYIATKKDLASYQGKLTLTTSNTEGASTLIGNTLNIPNYADTSIYNADGILLGGRTVNLGNNTLTFRAAASANQYVRIGDKVLRVVDATGTLFETSVDPTGIGQATGTMDARIDMVGGVIQMKGEDAVTLGGSTSDLTIGADGIIKFRKSASGSVDSLYGKNNAGELTATINSSVLPVSSSTGIINIAEVVVDAIETGRLPWDGQFVVGVLKTGLYLTMGANGQFVQHELIPNGNKGDITTSDGGATMTINAGAVTNEKVNFAGIQDTAIYLLGLSAHGRTDTVGLGGGLIMTNGTLAVTGLAGGTVTSITAGTGLTGGTITASGTIAADLNVLMELSDTASLSSRINGKLDSIEAEVTTFTIRDSAVTAVKIANNAVTNTKANFSGISGVANKLIGIQSSGTPDTVGLAGGLTLVDGILTVSGASGGTVTSVQLATGTSGTDINITGTNPVTTSGTITLNIPTASSANRGVLSAADWTTFNNKQSQLNGTGFVKANGTTITYDNSTYLTSASTLSASNLSGTIPTGVLGNSTMHVGTTAIALNRASANQALTGISSIQMPGATSGNVTLQPALAAGTTTITFPATTGTVITSGDNGTVNSSMIANGTIVNEDISNSAAIAVSKLAANTISGVTLGSNLNTLSMGVSGIGLSGSATYNGSAGSTFTVTSNATSANTTNTIVSRDASGNFSAGTITATLNGNASTATALQDTLDVSRGGTGVGSIVSGRIPVGNGISAITTNENLFYNTSANKLLVGSAWSKRPETLLSRLTVHAGQAADIASIDNGTVFYYLDQTFMDNAAAFFVSKNVNSPSFGTNNSPEPVIILGRPGNSGSRWGSVASFNLSSYGSGSVDPNTQLDITLAAINTEGSNLRRVMTLRANGNVGINKTEPTEALHVNGKVRIGNTASTPSHLIGLGSDSTIAYLPTATYPSLAELAYVKGTTSAIQTQLNGKLSSSAGAVGEANLATGAVTGTKAAITGITNHATRLVGAHSNGNLDTIAVGSGLNLTNGILTSTTVPHYVSITAFGATDTIPAALTNSKDFFVVHSGLNGYCIDSYQVRARSGTGSIDVQISLNGVYTDAQTVSGTTTVNKNTNRALSTGDVIQVNTANGSGTLIGLSVTYEIKQTCN